MSPPNPTPPPRPQTRPRPKKSSLSRIVAAVAVLALVAGGLWYWQQRRAAAAESPYRTATVERGDIRVAISATGTLSATSTVIVGSQISGQITDVLADFNDPVKKGQVIARLDPSTYQAQIRQGNAQVANARASLAQAQATLRNAELDYRRKTELAERQLVARSDVDLARAALEQAQAQVNSSQAQIRQQSASTETTQVNLERTVIRSPVDGVVLVRSVEPGQTVAASMSAPELFQIAENLQRMKIELAVDEADIGQVDAGQGVSFTVDAFPDRRFRGVVEQVRLAATTTNNVVTYPVVVAVDNGDGTLLPGLTVNAEIEVNRREDVLKIANAALRYKPAAAGADAPAAPARQAGAGGPGVAEALAELADSLELDAEQRAAFEAAAAAMRERAAARMAQAPAAGPGGPAAMGGAAPSAARGGGAGGQARQRMQQRFQQDFAEFAQTLDEAQRARWERELTALLVARRAVIYKLVDGRPLPVTVRIGAADGSSSEVSGDLQAGDLVVIGVRPPQ